MSILEDLTALLHSLDILIETGVFSNKAPSEYIVITPMTDEFALFADNQPQFEMQEVRLSLFSKGNYLARKNQIVRALLAQEYTITGRQYIEHEDDTGYHHYSVDVCKEFAVEQEG